MNNSFFNNDNDENNDHLEYLKEQEEIENISPQKKREFFKLFILLLTVGLIIGGIVSFVLIKTMSKFGLTDKTPQFERIQK
ncbi:hypothetical protein GM3708_3110 [Geminocystis sp. NIES-3708]|uniref:hypothetical protein n=1 Tax=Geminocystis sp. NIES-3708 TaxID=1615909 RepID=UPI0005FC468B|nr:hypothetical protein [Geminocystis sp. NIES-3708]BAQ62704.1 hypothetical protein GM3708_3110 [Geminocystis sp. NIES-3708]